MGKKEDDLKKEERRVIAQWLVDKATLDLPDSRKILPKNEKGFYAEEIKDWNSLKLLRLKNKYNYLKWAIEENKKLATTNIEVTDGKSKEETEVQDYQVIWAKDLKNYQEEEKEWIVDKLIPLKSVGILTGKRGTLKTFITLLLSVAVASGGDFLGKYETTKGKVITWYQVIRLSGL